MISYDKLWDTMRQKRVTQYTLRSEERRVGKEC